MNKSERQNRIIARGEISGHSHIVVGDNVTITREKDKVIIEVGENSNASLKHLLEKEFVETGKEVWTKEHKDIPLAPGKYEYIQQVEFDPYADLIRSVQD
jgi:hypothetical protein